MRAAEAILNKPGSSAHDFLSVCNQATLSAIVVGAAHFGLLLNSIAKFEIRCFLASDPGTKPVIPGEQKEQSNTYKLDSGREVEH